MVGVSGQNPQRYFEVDSFLSKVISKWVQVQRQILANFGKLLQTRQQDPLSIFGTPFAAYIIQTTYRIQGVSFLHFVCILEIYQQFSYREHQEGFHNHICSSS